VFKKNAAAAIAKVFIKFLFILNTPSLIFIPFL